MRFDAFEWQIGWRYLRGGGSAGGRGNRFIGFIAGASMLGITLGVAALIVVLSVVNGFQKEVRDRMLDVIPHVELIWRGAEPGAPPLQAMEAAARRTPGVVGVAPFLQVQALVGNGETLRGAVLRGVDPAAEGQVTTLAARLAGPGAPFAALKPGARQIVLGYELARALGLKPGDPVAVVLPPRPAVEAQSPAAAGASESPALPRTVRFTLAGVFDAGHYEFDNGMGYLNLADATELEGAPGVPAYPAGLGVRLADALQANAVSEQLATTLGPQVAVRNWTRSNRTWFEAVALQKRMLGLILVLIVAVAAFNLVSTLVMTVTDKRADIAILRTLGASPRSIMAIFLVQGALAGLVGTLGGVALGLGLALNLGRLVPALEHLLGTRFLPPSVYFIDHMPSLPLASDIVPITLASLALALLATLYPSWRASRVEPAVELRGE